VQRPIARHTNTFIQKCTQITITIKKKNKIAAVASTTTKKLLTFVSDTNRTTKYLSQTKTYERSEEKEFLQFMSGI